MIYRLQETPPFTINTLILFASVLAASLCFFVLEIITGYGLEEFAFGYARGNAHEGFAPTAARGAVYPLFVSILDSISRSVLIVAQLAIYLFSSLKLIKILFDYLTKLRIYWKFGFFIFVFLAFFNPRVIEYPMSISEESLFISILLFLLVLAHSHFKNASLVSAFFLGLVFGLLVSIRAIGFAFAPAIGLALIAAWAMAPPSKRAAPIVAIMLAVAGFALSAAAERAAYWAQLGDTPRVSLVGINLIAKAPFLPNAPAAISAEFGGPSEPAAAALSRAIANDATVADIVENADLSLAAHDFLINQLEFNFQLRGVSPDLLEAVQNLSRLTGEEPSIVARRAAIAAFADDPLGAATVILGNVRRFVLLAEFPDAASTRMAKELLATHPALANRTGAVMEHALEVADRYRTVGMVIRGVQAIAFGVAIVLVFWSIGALLRARRDERLIFGGVAAMMYLGYLFACAIVINEQVRYLMTVWPLTFGLFYAFVVFVVHGLTKVRRESFE